MNSDNFGMVKDESPPTQKVSPCNLGNLMQLADKELKMYKGTSDADKAASKSIQKFQSLPQVVLNSLPKLVVMSSSRLLPLSHRVQLAAFK